MKRYCFALDLLDDPELIEAENPKSQEWEALMWKYQQALPCAIKGEKWVLMEQIVH